MTTRTSLPPGFYRTTIVIGLGFFTMGLMDPLYDAFVPIFLRDHVASRTLIGTIMTLDNVFAVLLIPVVSAWSDQVRSPIGRRMPFIIVTLPLTAVLFGSIPTASFNSLAALVIVLFVMNLFKQAARGPVVALMPDTIPGEYRSEANGVINLMGGIAAIVGTVVLGPMMNISIELPLIGDTHRRLPFLLAAVLVVLATIAVFTFVKERSEASTDRTRVPLGKSLRAVVGTEERSALFVLVSLFVWFLGYQGVLPFLTLYSVEILGMSEGVAALSPGAVAVAYAVFAVPSGIIAHRLGRKRTIRSALVGLVLVLLAIFLFGIGGVGATLSVGARLAVFWGMLFIFGILWVTVITNSFPMLWQMAGYATMGIYTGLYYFFSQSAAIVSPPIAGGIIDLFGYPAVFLFAALCMAGAWICMGLVRRGEAGEAPATVPEDSNKA
jgi:MFS family permease